ncbi:helix-hairpin-helix domain-containing protein [Bifidobacterium sp. MA2]|uniref:Helix-hairpin-helix domain-containing protein n=1 Tax=Bifidobacterium santillanense TaxID=2809028 RepID=A0ABS5ULJ9_9BIFI|nr:helix-hairpin-helix domain-containing protein [Bifidobacterium santillanense]MBT1171789.1 helix-hairpin-helix domain-containing protein [Bifidobacterium santillanense]
MATVPLPPRPSTAATGIIAANPTAADDEPERAGMAGSSVRALSDLTGVRSEDMDDDFERRAKHGKPRLRLTATHALAAVLIMTFVTCMSLTLLIRQSLNYAALERDRSEQSLTVDDGTSGGSTAGPDESNGGRTTQSPDGPTDDTGRTDADGSTDGSPSAGSSSVPAPDPADTRIDLNTATLEELDSVPGIGPVTARKILEHRERIGRFTSVDQLLDVSGIGEKTLEKIRPEVRV